MQQEESCSSDERSLLSTWKCGTDQLIMYMKGSGAPYVAQFMSFSARRMMPTEVGW